MIGEKYVPKTPYLKVVGIIIQNTFILHINTPSYESFNPSRNMAIKYEGNSKLQMKRIKTRTKSKWQDKQAFISVFFKIVHGPSQIPPFGYHC